MKRIILAAVTLLAVSGMAGTASAQAVKPPMSPELQKIVDGAKTEKVMLSSTNPVVLAARRISMRPKPGSKTISASISTSTSPMADRSASSAQKSQPSSAPISLLRSTFGRQASRNTLRC